MPAAVVEPIDRPEEGAPEVGFDLRLLTPPDAARLFEILLTFARNGVGVIARQGPYLVLRPRTRGPRSLAVAVRRSFADLGPIFVKLRPVVAPSPGLFPGTGSDARRKLLDEGPPA